MTRTFGLIMLIFFAFMVAIMLIVVKVVKPSSQYYEIDAQFNSYVDRQLELSDEIQDCINNPHCNYGYYHRQLRVNLHKMDSLHNIMKQLR